MNKQESYIEIWGGVECSVVRVNDSVNDQLLQSNHENRATDLELFNELKIKKIRYPLLWEKYAAGGKDFFNLHEFRLNKLLELGIQPIIGLMHHGSGPFVTNLYDPDFPKLLADFAHKVAIRFPWIEFFTPVNEPLTTARFSGLYGIWYPHKKDNLSFLKILINELKGILLSMLAANEFNPKAKLVQTEDLCRVYSTVSLKYQADFENTRRWLTYDILLGKFTPDHPLWNFVVDCGIPEEDLYYFIGNKIQPAIAGFNYYVTSERFLDHRKYIYPSNYHGRNSFEEYADVEAVRANLSSGLDLNGILQEAWERYHLPIALTEIHMGCSREEQLRWFYDAYRTGVELKNKGVDFRAVTAWSFLGSFDWNSLLCSTNKYYESGVYDLRSGKPRPTALAGMIKSINERAEYSSPLLDVPGWWKRKDRFIYRDGNEKVLIKGDPFVNLDSIPPLLIVGATGSLGSAFAKACEKRGIIYHLTTRSQLDIASEESVRSMLEIKKPWAVINAAGFSRIDEAENSRQLCTRENITGPAILANICKLMQIRFVTFSSDQVFDGKKRRPYSVADTTEPLNFYGLSKQLAEIKISNINSDCLIIRSSFFFNPWHEKDNLYKILQNKNTAEKHFYLPSDIIMSPVYVPDFVNVVLDLLIDGERGIWHLSNQEEISIYDFVKSALNIAGIKKKIISPVPYSQMEYVAVRPPYSVLKSSSGITLPPLSNALHQFLNELKKESIVFQ